MKSGAGFTLVELLITISIIAILSAIGLIAYTDVLKQGRDAKRQSDLRSIQSALEQYNFDQGYYPLADNACTNGKLRFGNTDCALKDPTGNRTYINVVPSDPTPAQTFNYCYKPFSASEGVCDNSATKCVNYELYVNLDNPRRLSLIREAFAAPIANTQSQGVCNAGSPPRIDISWVVPGQSGSITYAVRVNDTSNDGVGAVDGWLVSGSGDVEDNNYTASPGADHRYHFNTNGIIGHSYQWWIEAPWGTVNGTNFACPVPAPIYGGGDDVDEECKYECDGNCYNYRVTPP